MDDRMERSGASPYLELGIFLPVANRNWIMAYSGPEDPATFALNLGVTRRAEAVGFDFVLGQSVWRGHGGGTKFWDESMECFTTAAALAAATERIGVVASVQPLLYPPAVAAKMVATIDDVSTGRMGINVVAGAHFKEYEQMGLVPDGYPAVKYDYLAEWTSIVQRLWTEDRVTHHGRYFDYEDCVCGPKPRQRPTPPVLCAGASPAGMEFTAAHATHAFVGAPTVEKTAALARAYKARASELGRDLAVYTVVNYTLEDTVGAAQARIDAYASDPDLEAIADYQKRYSDPKAGTSMAIDPDVTPGVFFGDPHPTTPQLATDNLVAMWDAGIDGVLVSCFDWDRDLDRWEHDIVPTLRDRGVVAPPPGGGWGRHRPLAVAGERAHA